MLSAGLAALGREAIASVPPGRASLGSGANNTARYVGSALGVTVVSVIAPHPGAGDPIRNLMSGWNVACLITAAFSLVGAIVVLACRPLAVQDRRRADQRAMRSYIPGAMSLKRE